MIHLYQIYTGKRSIVLKFETIKQAPESANKFTRKIEPV